MNKVYIIHENDEWIIPLRAELKRIGTPFEEWHMSKGNINLSEEPPFGVFYNRMSASSHTRGHYYAPEYTKIIINWLEGYSRRIVNNSRALSLELDKSLQYAELNKLGLKTPETYYAVGKDEIIKAASKFKQSFITKHNRAGKGLGVYLFNNLMELRNYVYGENFQESRDGITLIQEYIKSPILAIVRVEFVNSKFLYAVQVDASEGFELCPAEPCQADEKFCPSNETGNKFMILDNFNNPVIQQYENVINTNGIEIAGIEFITSELGEIYTYDINTNTNYNSEAEKLSNIKGMKSIAEFLTQELKLVTQYTDLLRKVS